MISKAIPAKKKVEYPALFQTEEGHIYAAWNSYTLVLVHRAITGYVRTSMSMEEAEGFIRPWHGQVTLEH